jgi:hypothetical protein
MGESYFDKIPENQMWSKRSVTEASISIQQLLKTHFHGNEYAHNSEGAVGCSVFPSVCNEAT